LALLPVFLLPSSFVTPTPRTDISTLSLHDALPISSSCSCGRTDGSSPPSAAWSTPERSDRSSAGRSASTRHPTPRRHSRTAGWRSEEHTSELQSRFDLVCRLLLEKKKNEDGVAGGA